ncbi:MAG: hypothetical protein NNA31_07815 [Nitrospira sp.]|nr:hypothetical protein [Nitrospira sp.]
MKSKKAGEQCGARWCSTVLSIMMVSAVIVGGDKVWAQTGAVGEKRAVTAKPVQTQQLPVKPLPPGLPAQSCPASALKADVVAIDHPIVFNRFGAQNINWMMYALRHDVIDLKSGRPLDASLLKEVRSRSKSRHIALRPDLRPRPLVLRVAAGNYLAVTVTNLLEVESGSPPDSSIGNPYHSDETDLLPGVDHPMEQGRRDPPGTPGEQRIFHIDEQVESRTIGFHVQGLELVNSISDDGSFVGANPNSLLKPGETRTYCLFAAREGTYGISSDGAVFGGDGTAGNSAVGLFGVVAVEPKGARFYRSQVTEEELRLATKGTTAFGQPIINYEALYPNDCPTGIWCLEGKAGLPILNMVHRGRLIHSDINAIIMGPKPNGSFPPSTYPLEATGKRNPTLPNRLEPFREFVSVYHDEAAATQAFPYFFEHPELHHTLHGVRDAFMINYGSGGIGSEIIANRLKAGPSHDCVDCAYEEFFLSAFTVGDPAMIVDRPVNLSTGLCQPEYLLPEFAAEFQKFCVQHPQDRATKAYYPHDPSNVHHSYIGDFLKFRNAHVGKEQHIFHLHNHQWLFNPNDDNSNYIDAQAIGPGSGYTYEIAFGGSGNRNRTVGDAIFHCHFYPHFAQGMWAMWRVHDVFEAGTRLKVSETRTGFHDQPFGLMDGTPSKGARALPDGEIVAGAPIPAVVPLPGKALAPMPGKVIVQPRIGLDSQVHGSVAKVIDRERNPGFPFWVAGIETTVGSRPTTPPLDMSEIPGVVKGHDGGLPRHALHGYSADAHSEDFLSRHTAKKEIKKAKPEFFPEQGTDLEQLAMKYHATHHPTVRLTAAGTVAGPALFRTNGAPPIPGAPFNEPCIDDRGKLLTTGQDARFFGGAPGTWLKVSEVLPGGIEFGADKPRVYKGANIQLDVVFNKLGYHYPQQRILALWEDVPPLLRKALAPEPLVIRMNTFDCAMYAHTNLVPLKFYEDDYQIETPTDVIGQHIHLPKWDLTSADGGANGWNYEDGTFSPGTVRERIHAINEWNTNHPAQAVPHPVTGVTTLVPAVHPFFNGDNPLIAGPIPLQKPGEACLKDWEEVGGNAHEFDHKFGMPGVCDWLGARTTLQRWFSDPVVNTGHVHRGLGTTFTHDHLGPSTHQQVGLYATMLSEPPGSEWRHNETGKKLYDPTIRQDGGPTSWQAVIAGKKGTGLDIDKDKQDDAHREFFIQFGDFQHAYEKGVYVGVNEKGWSYEVDTNVKPTPDTYRFAIHPSHRKPTNPVFPDIVAYEPTCPGGKNEHRLPGAVYNNPDPPLRPCPEAISADDVGMMVVNYRNEPVAARVYDPKKVGPDGKAGAQTSGPAGDLALALQTRTDRAIPELNTPLGVTPYPALTNGVLKGDPFTPILRAYAGDLIRVKVQAGSHEHEHNGAINGLLWLQGGSGYGQAPHSGWRNSQNTGLSEQFTFTARLKDHRFAINDRLYVIDASQDGIWNGAWGVVRSYDQKQADLVPLPSHPLPSHLPAGSACPASAPVRSYQIAAVLANQVLDPVPGISIPPAAPGSTLDPKGGTLVYNPRQTQLTLLIDGKPTTFGAGPLHDPTAILFVRLSDLDPATGKLKPGAPLEPVVIRAAAGDCVQVALHNRLPVKQSHMPDLDGYTALSGTVIRDHGVGGSSMTTFNNNLIRPSNVIGLHPQMVHYDIQASDGDTVGVNLVGGVAPGGVKLYQWYAGVLDTETAGPLCPDYAGNDLARQFDRLSLFTREPRLRPLNEFMTPELFANVATAILERALQGQGLARVQPGTGVGAAARIQLASLEGTGAPIAPSPIVSPSRQGDPGPLAQAVPPVVAQTQEPQQIIPSLVRQLTAAVQNAQCFEGPPTGGIQGLAQGGTAGRPRNEGTFLADDGKQPRAQHDGAPLLSPRSQFDPLALVPQRQRCREQLHSDFVRILSGVLGGNTLEVVALRLAESFKYEVVGVAPGSDGRAEYGWRLDRYPDYTPNTTRLVMPGTKQCRFVPVEFGASNLTPPDRIKQGQKAAVGAMVIEPAKAQWLETIDDWAMDRQDPTKQRRSRATATVTYPTIEGEAPKNRAFREIALVHQKGLNLRDAKGAALANLAAEKAEAEEPSDRTVPEDAHDAGHMAINYGTEPMWFRFGLPPDAPFGRDGFAGAVHAWQAFSNSCCSTGGSVTTTSQPVGDPAVPILRVRPGSELRLRTVMPTGVGRGTVMELHGHHWPRDPYLAERLGVGGFPNGSRPADWGVGSQCIGRNPLNFALGGQESMTPMAHFDLVMPRAGGKHRVKGDYLYRDHAGFGITNGLWALVRVEGLPVFSSGLRSSCRVP